MQTRFRVIISIVVCLCAGFLGSMATTSSLPIWYATLHKPFFTPPSWVFAPAWTLLYILMGIAAALVWQKAKENPATKGALLLFGMQLVANVLWSVIFFGQHQLFLSVIEIKLLWLLILGTGIAFYRISRPAGWLLLPYLLWVSFAAVLNSSIWWLNQ
ncbi:MAG: TspO/MBR family protein [Candidatus Margulisiibacteriota bacterium]